MNALIPDTWPSCCTPLRFEVVPTTHAVDEVANIDGETGSSVRLTEALMKAFGAIDADGSLVPGPVSVSLNLAAAEDES